MRSALLLLMLMALACGPSLQQLQPLAAARQLQPDAPVKADAALDIDAPIDAVWSILAAIEQWPQWNDDAAGAHVDGPFVAGTRFSYGQHRLALACIEPPHSLTFLGTVAGYKGITVWELTALSPDRTHVAVRESNDGFLISVFYSARQLEAHLRLWLTQLKKEAERPR